LKCTANLLPTEVGRLDPSYESLGDRRGSRTVEPMHMYRHSVSMA